MRRLPPDTRVDAKLLVQVTTSWPVRRWVRGTVLKSEVDPAFASMIGDPPMRYLVEVDRTHALPYEPSLLPGETKRWRWCQEFFVRELSLLDQIAEAAR